MFKRPTPPAKTGFNPEGGQGNCKQRTLAGPNWLHLIVVDGFRIRLLQACARETQSPRLSGQHLGRTGAPERRWAPEGVQERPSCLILARGPEPRVPSVVAEVAAVAIKVHHWP